MLFIMHEMKERRSCEMIWSIVEAMISSGQVVGLLEKITCRIASVERREKCDDERGMEA